MLGLIRKSEYFRERIEKQIYDRIEKLPDNDKNEILNVKGFDDDREKLMKNFEEELKNLELKYDKVLREFNVKRNNNIQGKGVFSDFWLRVLGNNKLINDFISDSDRDVLKHLKNISSMKLEDGNSFKLAFEFEPNEYFSNTLIEKSYHIGRDLLLDKVESTTIQWKEGKNLCSKTISKNLKNKKTGEKKTVEDHEPLLTFFNFFTNISIPSLEQMKKLDFETEKEIAAQLDIEYSVGIEFTDEIIPNSLEYFVGVTHETEEEIEEYMHEMMAKQKGKSQKKK